MTDDTKVTVELVGGIHDGHRLDLDPEQLLGRLEFPESRTIPSDVTARLLRGERVPAVEWEHPDVIVHVYSRTDRRSGGAVLYRYVRPA